MVIAIMGLFLAAIDVQFFTVMGIINIIFHDIAPEILKHKCISTKIDKIHLKTALTPNPLGERV